MRQLSVATRCSAVPPNRTVAASSPRAAPHRTAPHRTARSCKQNHTTPPRVGPTHDGTRSRLLRTANSLAFATTTSSPGQPQYLSVKQHPLTPGIANFVLASSQQRKPKKQVRCYDGFRKSGDSLVGPLLLYTFPSPRQEGMYLPAYAPSKLPLVPVYDTCSYLLLIILV